MHFRLKLWMDSLFIEEVFHFCFFQRLLNTNFYLWISNSNKTIWLFIIAKESKQAEVESKEGVSISEDPALVKLTKPEKRLQQKKLRKEAKKQAKEEVLQTPQDQVLVRFFSRDCILGLAAMLWIYCFFML